MAFCRAGTRWFPLPYCTLRRRPPGLTSLSQSTVTAGGFVDADSTHADESLPPGAGGARFDFHGLAPGSQAFAHLTWNRACS
jgi:hypothetical protein